MKILILGTASVIVSVCTSLFVATLIRAGGFRKFQNEPNYDY